MPIVPSKQAPNQPLPPKTLNHPFLSPLSLWSLLRREKTAAVPEASQHPCFTFSAKACRQNLLGGLIYKGATFQHWGEEDRQEGEMRVKKEAEQR